MESVVREKISGFTFVVRPTVFNPKDFISSGIFSKYIAGLNLNGKTILDMGAGSGIVSVFAASRGAKCLAADINPVAIRCIRENAALNHFEDKIETVESDLFISIKPEERKFDIIFFNPPYYRGNPRNNFERAFKGGPNLEVIDRFLTGSKEYLYPKGKLCFIISSDMDMDDFSARIEAAGFIHKILQYNKRLLETFYIIEAVII
jgi:release factor glutamine methyltransferase